MGGVESSEATEDVEELSLANLSGYRVMRVFQGSPATRAGLMPFEDFIMAVDSVLCDAIDNTLGTLLDRNENKDIDLLVWNCIDERERQVRFKPMRWTGPGLLGAAVKHEKLENAADCVWHVIDLSPRSPADDAGLVPDTDYIVGTPAAVFQKEEDLNASIKEAARYGEVVTLCVYSSATGRLREVELAPNDNWGGKGLLGCELATGWLHRIPPRVDVTAENQKVVEQASGSARTATGAGNPAIRRRDSSSSFSAGKKKSTDSEGGSRDRPSSRNHSRQSSKEDGAKRTNRKGRLRKGGSESSLSARGSDADDLR